MLYQGIRCEKSIYIFSKQNKFRLFCYKVQKHPLFDRFVMFLIAVSSLKLGIDSYLVKLPEGSWQISASEVIDIIVNVLFLFECLFKVIALGFMMDEGSYIRESWN